ncbi:MAG: cobalamin biosynthesis protein CbiD [Clostridia bacterium]|nr:cobalamin biosynthesis protein CbiD [Clostridia bacterium]
MSGHDGALCFRAGDGVGTITRPGLKLSPGEPAINPVPRQMIEQAVRSIIGRMAAEITIGITDGQILAVKTFNPRLGIEGGLSILGTTGIVHPMSDEAITETIRLELQMHRTAGADTVALVFGSQGETAVNQLRPGLPCVQISNFVGFASDTACELGFLRMLLAGQPGKLVKVAGGCMQTHSRYGDGRRETLCARLALMGAPVPLLAQVMESVTLDGLISVITDSGYSPVWSSLCQAASVYLHARTHDRILIDTMMLDSSGQIIGEYHDT